MYIFTARLLYLCIFFYLYVCVYTVEQSLPKILAIFSTTYHLPQQHPHMYIYIEMYTNNKLHQHTHALRQIVTTTFYYNAGNPKTHNLSLHLFGAFAIELTHTYASKQYKCLYKIWKFPPTHTHTYTCSFVYSHLCAFICDYTCTH